MLARFEAGRRSPVPLELRTPDGRSLTLPHKTGPTVRITGDPGELVLFAFGRGKQTTLQVDGPADAVTALHKALPLP